MVRSRGVDSSGFDVASVILPHLTSEPTYLVRLRWGNYRSRYVAAIALIISGAVSLQSSNTYSMLFLLFGSVAFLTGWIVLPAQGRRRAWVTVPSFLAVVLLVIGPQAVPALVVPFVCWLFVRERPARSYFTAIPVLVCSVALATTFREWKDMPLTLALMTLVIVVSAWLAFRLSGVRRIPSQLAASAE